MSDPGRTQTWSVGEGPPSWKGAQDRWGLQISTPVVPVRGTDLVGRYYRGHTGPVPETPVGPSRKDRPTSVVDTGTPEHSLPLGGWTDRVPPEPGQRGS